MNQDARPSWKPSLRPWMAQRPAHPATANPIASLRPSGWTAAPRRLKHLRHANRAHGSASHAQAFTERAHGAR
eukprot:2401213-Heterocapsa_arctica.AAC.1